MREILTLPHGRRRAAACEAVEAPPAVQDEQAARPRHHRLAADACADCCDLAWTTTAAFRHPALRKLGVRNAEARSGDDSIHEFSCEHCGQCWAWSARTQWSVAEPRPRGAARWD
ncbi:hypothetical protein [Solimonas soli]|uniref:hypothetical protein n=1 Tax=Solimonas soli TaxID=413479 RepID=UPI0012FA0649|nr:hypothetical protein [Solimonas soli]